MSVAPSTRTTSRGGLARTRAVSSSNSSLPGTGRVTPSNSSCRCAIKLHIHARHDQVCADGYEHATIELQPDSIGIELLPDPTPCVFIFIDLSSISISRTRRQSATVPAAHLLQHGGVQPAEHIYTEPTCYNCIDITNLTHRSTPSVLHQYSTTRAELHQPVRLRQAMSQHTSSSRRDIDSSSPWRDAF